MPLTRDDPSALTVRAFVAANLDASLKEALAGVQERLKATRADVGWVKPEHLHLTLKFLGHVEEARLGPISEAVASAVCGYGSFRLTLGGLGAFPQPRAARVVWIGVPEGADLLAGLQARLEEKLEALGFARETRPFTAHLTLGRVRGPGRREQLASALISMPVGPVGEMVVDQIQLMRSDLGREGPRYAILRSFPLGPSP